MCLRCLRRRTYVCCCRFVSASIVSHRFSIIYALAFACSVDPENGHFLTIDPTYDFDTFPASRPDFKKTKKAAAAGADSSDVDAFVTKIKRVDLYKYRDFDKEFYRQTIADTLALCEEEIITPYVSRTFGLSEVNDAVEFIKEKKCTGKVLIDIRQKDVIDSDDEGKTK